MCGRRCRRLCTLDVAYRCILHPLFQQIHDHAHLAAVAALASDHALNMAKNIMVIAVVAELLHDPCETPLRETQPFDVGAQVTCFLHPGSPSD
jgi:hypothetical protein